MIVSTLNNGVTKYDPTSEELSIISDRTKTLVELSELIGVSVGTISKWRKVYGLANSYRAPYRRIVRRPCQVEAIPLLGTMTDSDIADRFGVSKSVARCWRVERSITPYRFRHAR